MPFLGDVGYVFEGWGFETRGFWKCIVGLGAAGLKIWRVFDVMQVGEKFVFCVVLFEGYWV